MMSLMKTVGVEVLEVHCVARLARLLGNHDHPCTPLCCIPCWDWFYHVLLDAFVKLGLDLLFLMFRDCCRCMTGIKYGFRQ